MSRNGHAGLVVGATAILALAVGPPAIARAGDSPAAPRANASTSVKKSVKKLKQQFDQLADELATIEAQPGPEGPRGAQGARGPTGATGEEGPPGPSTGPAGGALSGHYPDPAIADAAVTLSKLAGSSVDSSKVVSDSLTGADVDEPTLSGLWFEGGNAATGAGDFLGTTDNNPLDLRVNNARGLRLEPGSDGTNQSPNVIGGIADNAVTAGVHSATIAGGGRANPLNPNSANRVTDDYGTVGGGANNQAGDGDGPATDRAHATVGGGRLNTAGGEAATVGGGASNGAGGVTATVSGGTSNSASGGDATVGGGIANGASEAFATVGGGGFNHATGFSATVPGGQSNLAAEDFSFAAGTQAKANHQGAFVWADSSVFDFSSTAQDQFSARSTGGARFVSAVDGSGNPSAGVELASGGGSWSSLSDRASKRAVAAVSGLGVLRRLDSVPISTWSYRAQDDSTRHIGPMAQDFFRAFGVGEDRRHIASVDADGVALAAIKGLNAKVERLQRRMAALRHRRPPSSR